ncbi:alpha/beta hydrolase [Sporolactobacillus sp. CQH2019]|uniref:SA1320 family protein n=1 Tax=Sporolactobacillus sp. CQH2019 TaxID=3023512 RepID=UPI0023679AAD|nr:alpha/beta hydrolase [Sporolactobacillus sp. CQH2019]MDD9147991.1 alpha/beta hydrolase [Sporolactobacillus sp. CQH2019]
MGTISRVVKAKTSDQDLIHLSGYSIYKYPPKQAELRFNGNYFLVIGTNYKNLPSGLDAMVIQDEATKNISIIYAGTDPNQPADIGSDAGLVLSSGTPQQFKDAEAYYNNMKATYGHVDFVAGNSLGGGLANYVAVRNNVHSVTLDPSILPANVVEPSVNSAAAKRMTNYFGGYDPLTLGEVAGGYGGRIPGAKINVDFGISWLTFLTNNHTGYVGGTDPSTPQENVPVGVQGTPSAGRIEFMADHQIVTDIWTGEPLTAETVGKGQRIKIDTGSMEKLSSGLSNPILSGIRQADGYLNHSVQTVESEGARLDDRQVSLQNQFNQLLYSTQGIGPFLLAFDELKKINPRLSAILEDIYWISSLPLAEKILETVSAGLEKITMPLIGIPASIADLDLKMEDLTVRLINLRVKAIPLLFHGLSQHFFDGIVDELKAHDRIVGKNMDLLTNQLSRFRDQTDQVRKIMNQADRAVARAFENGSGVQQITANVDSSFQGKMEPSNYLRNGMTLRKQQLEQNFQAFSRRADEEIRPILNICFGLAGEVIDLLQTARTCLTAFSWEADLIRIPFLSWNNQLREFLSQTKQILSRSVDTVENFSETLNHVQRHFSDLMLAFKPYIETALFNGTQYQAVIAYHHATLGILQDIRLQFRDIIYQLSENESAAILQLENHSKAICNNLSILIEQVKRGTVV